MDPCRGYPIGRKALQREVDATVRFPPAADLRCMHQVKVRPGDAAVGAIKLNWDSRSGVPAKNSHAPKPQSDPLNLWCLNRREASIALFYYHISKRGAEVGSDPHTEVERSPSVRS
jgi:hypothetical protein